MNVNINNLENGVILDFSDLTKDAFEKALAKGLGRAMLYVRKNGIDEVDDLVLDACLRLQAYDPQSEESKTE